MLVITRRRLLRWMVISWVLTLAVEWILYRYGEAHPLWGDLLRPVQVVLLFPALTTTWQALRPRGRVDRRGKERRRGERRGEE